jgi:hypothetical protein
MVFIHVIQLLETNILIHKNQVINAQRRGFLKSTDFVKPNQVWFPTTIDTQRNEILDQVQNDDFENFLDSLFFSCSSYDWNMDVK